MRKIDLHIHTLSTSSDSSFIFSSDKLREYVETFRVDCIAITNHNLFDLGQFKSIEKDLKEVTVLPGIEINLEKGHLLLVSENKDLGDFSVKCRGVSDLINTPSKHITVDELIEVFVDLKNYLLIPHYDKSKEIRPEVIEKLKEHISAGEVASIKKFRYCLKDPGGLTPLLFSDFRALEGAKNFPQRQTFIDTDDLTLKSIKACLMDRSKVSLSEDGHDFFEAFPGQSLSTGLNVILGKRSSGKTHTIKKIHRSFRNVKYIEQFGLLAKDEKKDIQEFKRDIGAKKSSASDEFFKEFKDVVGDVIRIDRKEEDAEIQGYLDSLLKFAADEVEEDEFSKVSLYGETPYSELENSQLDDLIKATKLLFENVEYKNIIDEYITKDDLRKLVLDLILKRNEQEELNLKKKYVNSIISDINFQLQSRTALLRPEDIDFYAVRINKEKLEKFNKIANLVKRERLIKESDVGKFQIVTKTKKYKSAQELKNKSGRVMVFSEAFKKYDHPIDFLEELKLINSLGEADYYKYFVDVDYKILNEDKLEVSGGERSEFNLLNRIRDAHHYDILLIDEPESSFDNIFLKDEVNKRIKEISRKMPVVIVTHNNTVGASIFPDYILYTRKEIVDKKPIFTVFSGYPADKELKSIDGETISNYDVMLDCLEAGDIAYNNRKKTYETLKD